MRASRPRRATGLVAPLLLGACLLAVWAAVTLTGSVPAFVIPAPGAVLARLVHDLTTPALWPYVGQTLAEAVGGVALGAATGLPLAILLHRYRWLDAAVSPYLGATQAIPAIALAPLLVLWVGYGLGAIVALCALIVFFPILISALLGLRGVDPDIVDAARMDGASRWQALWHVERPGALPSILAGLRNGVTLSVTGAVVGEMVMGGQGLGMLLTLQRDAVDTAGMFSTILILCALAMAFWGLIRAWEKRSQAVDSLPGRSGRE